MGCGCHSSKKAQPIRETVRRSVSTVPVSEPILRNVYRAGSGISKKRIIRRSIGH